MMKGVLTGVGAIGLLLGASGVQAEDCTIGNWKGTAVNLTDDDAGKVSDSTQERSYRRYAGPCGLNVPLSGVEAYLVDTNPDNEQEFNVRFYFFLNDVASDVTFYQALDGATEVITAKYDESDNEVDVVFGASQEVFSLGPVSSGWNSLEIQWESDATATLRATLANASDTFTDTASNVDTSAFAVDSARLGAINALVATMPSAGSIDFDDYDSRRDTVPGRLTRGDANGDDAVTISDLFSVQRDRTGAEAASGQPDCNEDGSVTISDIFCVNNIRTGG